MAYKPQISGLDNAEGVPAALTATTLALNGATLGSNILAVTGTGTVMTVSGNALFNNTVTVGGLGVVSGGGSPTAPFYLTYASSQTGMYGSASNNIDFTCGGVRVGGFGIGGTFDVVGIGTVASATATPAGGSTSARLLFGTTSGFGIYYGSGAPTVSAAQGSIYIRSDGGANTRLYSNNNGTTGWTGLTSS